MKRLLLKDLDQAKLDQLVRNYRYLQADYDALFTDYQLQKSYRFIATLLLISATLWAVLK